MELENPLLMKASAGKILMLLENDFYPEDTRVRNEASLLTSAGFQVFVITLRKNTQEWVEDLDGVRVYRLPRLQLFKKTPSVNPNRAQVLLLRIKSFLGYLSEYLYFTAACFLVSAWIFIRHGFDVIHAHNPPDTLFLAALPFKLLGKKFVFDHHDLCPELYQSRYTAEGGLYARMLLFLEWCSLKLANITIATNESYKQAQIARGGKSAETIFIVRNGPDHLRMTPATPSPRLIRMRKCILGYIGSLNPQDGVDYLLRSLQQLLYTLKRDDFYCVIMGTGDSLADLRALAADLRLDQHVELPGYVSEEDLRANLAAADICLDPDPSSPLNNVSTWIKIMEYMAYAKPIVTFDLKETRFSAQSAAIYVKPNDELDFAKAIVKLMDEPSLRKELGECGRRRVENELQWSVVGRELLAAYRFLLPSHESNLAERAEQRNPAGIARA
jgi:glycosyltransferase involved in cell wall biosynthesis